MQFDVVFPIEFGLIFVLGPTKGICWLVLKGLAKLDERAGRKHQARVELEMQRSREGTQGPRHRAFLKSCTHCGAFALTLPHRDQLGRTYCSEACKTWVERGPTTFCQKCTFETTAQSSGNLGTINGIGTSFVGSADRCEVCRSVVRRVWFTVFLVPVIPLRRYRVIHPTPQQFLSRRIKA